MNRKHSILALACFSLLCIFSQQSFGQAAGTKPELVMYRYNSGPVSPSNVLQGNLLGTLKWDGLTAIGNIKTGASIQSYVTNAVSPGFLYANLVFRTGAPDQQNRMVITETGLVGIGTMDPQYHLHVVGNTHTSGDFFGRIHMDASLGISGPGPNTYLEEAYFEYKLASDMGVADNLTNGGLLTLAPSLNNNAVKDHQLFFNTGGIYHRDGDGGSNVWAGAWKRLLTSADINGTPNRIAKFTGTNSLGNSQLFDDGTDVGIGTLVPDAAYLLTVGGDTRVNGNIRSTGSLDVDANANVDGNATVTVNASIGNNAVVGNNLNVQNNADVDGNLNVDGEAHVTQRMNIGTNVFATDYLLSVGGGIIAEEVRVQLEGDWSDYVFEENYPLLPLSEVEKFVQQEKHLPGIISAKEVADNGLNLGEMQKAHMEKIEELFLHMIALEKRVNVLEAQNRQLATENQQLRAQRGNDNGKR